MQFEGLTVDRVVMHEIFKRGPDKAVIAPSYSDEIEELNSIAMDVFRRRLTDVLSPGGKSLEMAISDKGPESFVHRSANIVGKEREAFLDQSKALALKLARAQTPPGVPGGQVVVFHGSAGVPAVPLVGVIKAETTGGFRRTQKDKKSVLEFLNNIFLTPSTKLYKVGIMLNADATSKGTEGWKAFIFDTNMSQLRRENAATYFYETFLGCAFPSDGAYETARFFDLTKKFVKATDLPPDRKRALVDSLFVFVRDEQDPTFTVAQYAERYVPQELRDPYVKHMRAQKFRDTAVVRDTADMGSRLKRRAYKFGSDILLSGPPQALANDVKIGRSAVAVADGIESDEEGWTYIRIRRPYVGEK